MFIWCRPHRRARTGCSPTAGLQGSSQQVLSLLNLRYWIPLGTVFIDLRPVLPQKITRTSCAKGLHSALHFHQERLRRYYALRNSSDNLATRAGCPAFLVTRCHRSDGQPGTKQVEPDNSLPRYPAGWLAAARGRHGINRTPRLRRGGLGLRFPFPLLGFLAHLSPTSLVCG